MYYTNTEIRLLYQVFAKKRFFYERNLVTVAYYNFKALTGKIFGVLQVLAYAKWSLTRGGRS